VNAFVHKSRDIGNEKQRREYLAKLVAAADENG